MAQIKTLILNRQVSLEIVILFLTKYHPHLSWRFWQRWTLELLGTGLLPQSSIKSNIWVTTDVQIRHRLLEIESVSPQDFL